MVVRMDLGMLGEKVAYGLGLKRDFMRPVGGPSIFKKIRKGEPRCRDWEEQSVFRLWQPPLVEHKVCT